MKGFILVGLLFLVVLWRVEATKEDNTKNHRLEKRQDNGFLFFGGWRPVRPSNTFLHGSVPSKFPDILSAYPSSYDTAATSYYSRTVPSQYMKDIYSYYPRPAIKSVPKKNTPIYMERLRPQKQQQQKYRGGGNSHQGPQLVDLQGIDFQHLQNIDFRYLQDLFQHTKEISLPKLNLPIGNAKPLEILEVSLDSLHQNGQSYGSNNNNKGYDGPRNAQRNNKGGHRKRSQSRRPPQSPVQYSYISVPKNNPILPQTLPKEFDITPIHFPYQLPAIEEVIKNIQAVELPINTQYEVNNNKGGSRVPNYDKGVFKYNNQQYRASPPKKPQNDYAQTTSYYTRQTEQPRKQYVPPKQNTKNHIVQPDIEAELIKLSEHELKHLLSNLQILDKSPHDLLKHLPFGNIGHSKEQLVLSLPEAGYNEGENSPVRSYNTHQSSQQSEGYGKGANYGGSPQTTSYQTKEVNSYSLNTGGYQVENHQTYQSHDGGSYQTTNHQSHDVGGYQAPNQGHDTGSYHIESHQNQDDGGYYSPDPSPRSNDAHYGQSSYQNVESQPEYEQQKNYYQDGREHQNSSPTNDEHYPDSNQDGTHKEQQGAYGQREQSYIQVLTPQADENGYRREPVLAVEIQHGQTIEDAIKSLDPETLKKLGTHGENGIEIEVVEVPIDEYASESKKTETVVSAKNSTIDVKPKKSDSKS